MLPPAAHYRPNYIGETDEAGLLGYIDRAGWIEDLKRRVQDYGYRCDYRERRVTEEPASRTVRLTVWPWAADRRLPGFGWLRLSLGCFEWEGHLGSGVPFSVIGTRNSVSKWCQAFSRFALST